MEHSILGGGSGHQKGPGEEVHLACSRKNKEFGMALTKVSKKNSRE